MRTKFVKMKNFEFCYRDSTKQFKKISNELDSYSVRIVKLISWYWFSQNELKTDIESDWKTIRRFENVARKLKSAKDRMSEKNECNEKSLRDENDENYDDRKMKK